jgi:hypothetical protein
MDNGKGEPNESRVVDFRRTPSSKQCCNSLLALCAVQKRAAQGHASLLHHDRRTVEMPRHVHFALLPFHYPTRLAFKKATPPMRAPASVTQCSVLPGLHSQSSDSSSRVIVIVTHPRLFELTSKSEGRYVPSLLCVRSCTLVGEATSYISSFFSERVYLGWRAPRAVPFFLPGRLCCFGEGNTQLYLGRFTA